MARFETRFQRTALGAVARAERQVKAARTRRQKAAPAYFAALTAERRSMERRRRQIAIARALGCSIREIADAAGLHAAHVSRIERGERT